MTDTQNPTSTPYFIPPDDYEAPRCRRGCLIRYVPVVGGHRWVHHQPQDHEVEMPRWWNTRTGRWRRKP